MKRWHTTLLPLTLAVVAVHLVPAMAGTNDDLRADSNYSRQHGVGLLGLGNDLINGIGLGFVGCDFDDTPLSRGERHGTNRYAVIAGDSYRFNEYADHANFKQVQHLLGTQMVVRL